MGIFSRRPKDHSQRDLYSAVPWQDRDGIDHYPDPERIAPPPVDAGWSGKLADCE